MDDIKQLPVVLHGIILLDKLRKPKRGITAPPFKHDIVLA
jgi:hypothetical protein